MATKTDYRIRLARALSGYEGRGTLTAAGQRTATGGSLATLTEARWPILSPRLLRTNSYDGAYLLRPTALQAADQLRVVIPNGLNSQTGQLTPDADWQNAPAADEPYELHLHGIEPADGVTDLLNTALKAIYLKVDVAFAPATDAKGAYVPAADAAGLPLSTWLVDEGQLLALRTQASYVASGALNGPETGGALRGVARRDGDRLYLLSADGLMPTTTLYATTKKPAYYHCRASGAAAYGSQAGLTVEASEALPSPEWVTDGALVAAWEAERSAMEAALERRRDKYLVEAANRFAVRNDMYWKSNPPTASYTPRGVWATAP